MNENWSIRQQKRMGTYERNLKMEKLADMGVPYDVIGKLQKPRPISRQRVCQILDELEKARKEREIE